MSVRRIGALRHLLLVLEHFGWVRSGGVDGKFEVWTPPDGSDFAVGARIFIPVDEDAVDFDAVMEEAWRRLRDVSNAAQQRMLDSLAIAGGQPFGLAEWKAETTVGNGAIPWQVGIQLFRSAHRQLLAAARATRPVGLKGLGKKVRRIDQEFLRTTLMGQTQKGSYVISALTPSDHVLLRLDEYGGQDAKLFGEATKSLTNGHVLTTLGRSLEALRGSITEFKHGRSPDVFERFASSGVSKALVEAVRECTERTEVEISITQSATAGRSPVVVVFGPEEEEPLRSAEHFFEYAVAARAGAYTGQVELLQRKEGNRIRFRTEINGKRRVVQVELSPEQYGVAIDAHKRMVPVLIQGQLAEVRGKLPSLTDVTSVKPISQDELFDGR